MEDVSKKKAHAYRNFWNIKENSKTCSPKNFLKKNKKKACLLDIKRSGLSQFILMSNIKVKIFLAFITILAVTCSNKEINC